MSIAKIQTEVAAEVERIGGEASHGLDDMIDSAEHAIETAAICYTAASRKDRRAALVKTAAYALLALEAMDEADKPAPIIAHAGRVWAGAHMHVEVARRVGHDGALIEVQLRLDGEEPPRWWSAEELRGSGIFESDEMVDQ